MQFEGIGDGFEFPDGQENSVYFSVAEIRHNVIGPALFTVDPLRIKAFKNEPIEPLTPDEISGSAVHSLDLRQWVYEGLPPLDQQIAAYAYDKLLLRIKDIVAKGGNVTVDDFGRFEARWSASKPVRGPAGTSYLKPGTRGIGFAPSPGFKEGTERGYVMTDADVKALV